MFGFDSGERASCDHGCPVIELQDLSKSYGETLAVDRISLTVARGELLFLVGGSGSGKTTTLKLVNRLIEPTGGRVLVDGEDVREGPAWAVRRRMGYVFQGIGLFPHLTVGENVAVTPALLGWQPERITARVEELLGLVELDPGLYRDRLPGELSGGQRQRVGVARALAAEPRVVLFDEPFGALDPPTRDRLQRWFDGVRRRLGLSGLFVTHDMSEALLLADRIAVLDHGRMIQVGTPSELMRAPAAECVAELLETPRRQASILSGFEAGPMAGEPL
jgi:osmoprotectant transport system ATP-binding protein